MSEKERLQCNNILTPVLKTNESIYQKASVTLVKIFPKEFAFLLVVFNFSLLQVHIPMRLLCDGCREENVQALK